MDRKAIVVCSVVGFLGLLSAALGFAAEATKIQDSQIEFTSPSTCIYPSSPALGLGFTAAVALMVAQIIINVMTGCICCERGSYRANSNWTIALVCFVVSWFTFVIAFLLLLTGAALNNQHGEESMYLGNYYCYVVKPGVFAGAAALSLASVILGIVYYLALNSAKNSNINDSWGGPPPNQSGIAVGQPQFPPPNTQGPPPPYQSGIAMGPPHVPPPNTQDPVFVHEDTYMRRQFT